MITTAQEYYDLLYKIQDENFPSLAVLLPSSEKIFQVDLTTRKIEAPDFLSVELDHKAETIYFEVDRYFDATDLATTACVVQYVNAEGEGRLYPVPFYDIETFSGDNKMIFPWVIGGEATKAAGDVKYSIRFYKIDETGQYFTYNLNTVFSTSRVLHGMDVSDVEDYDYPAEVIENIYLRLNRLEGEFDIYWLEL